MKNFVVWEKLRNFKDFEIEKELNFSTGSIGKWRQFFPSIEKVYSVSEYFGISLDEICSKDRKMSDTGFMDMLIKKSKGKRNCVTFMFRKRN